MSNFGQISSAEWSKIVNTNVFNKNCKLYKFKICNWKLETKIVLIMHYLTVNPYYSLDRIQVQSALSKRLNCKKMITCINLQLVTHIWKPNSFQTCIAPLSTFKPNLRRIGLIDFV